MTEPLIYTSKGNLPIASLIFETEWDNNLAVKITPYFDEGTIKFKAELEGSMVCKPHYYLMNEDGTKGEKVQNDVYVYHTGINLDSETGQLN